MALVNNATGVYATLGYNFSDPNGDVVRLSANTMDHLNSMPAFIESWQAKDIADNAVGGYYQNPVAANINSIIVIAQNIKAEANIGFSYELPDCDLIELAANTLSTTANSFLAHTNRISGVTPYVGQDVENPYYDNAISLGKTALYITNQTDNISNNSPIMGSFTSILIGPQIKLANTALAANLVVLTSGVNSNTLTQSQATKILTAVQATNTLLAGRQAADLAYYTNLRSFVDKYNEVKKFSNMGETETYLVKDFVGTNKIKQRLKLTS